MKRIVMVLLLLALPLACSKKEEKPAPDKKEEKAKKAEAPKVKKVRIRGLAPDSPRSRGEEIATPQDFEEEASRTVALENLEAELDRLEAEIIASSK